MSVSVAIDGGQSGLRLRCLPSGATGTARGFSYQAGDGNAAATAFAVESAARVAGLSEPVDVVCAGLSGAPADPLLRSRLAARIAQALDAREVRLCPDMVTAHAGALGGAAGTVLAAGTGVVCLGVGTGGRTHRVDGWGHLFGDAGSAFAIGRAGLVAVHRAGDGRAGTTLLSDLARQAYDVELSQLAQSLYTSQAVVSEVARFAPYVVEAAVAGDAAALEIVEQAASNLAETTATAVRAVGVETVAYTGKLFEAGPVLLEPFMAELARLVPGVELLAAQGDPLDGAERLATGPLGAYEPLVHVSGPQPRPAGPDLPFPRGALIVSCQARPDNPLRGPEPMVLMARAALAGGAAGIRANGPADIAAIRAAVNLAVIGIFKQGSASGVSITPTKQAASDVVAAGAHIVALDGTLRPRPNGESLAEQIAHIHGLGALAMTDVDSLESGAAAREAGADIVASTLSGYTGGGVPPGPDLALIAALTDALDCPVIAEGRYWTPSDVRAAFDLGAYAVVVGTAVTNPMAITRRLATAGP